MRKPALRSREPALAAASPRTRVRRSSPSKMSKRTTNERDPGRSPATSRTRACRPIRKRGSSRPPCRRSTSGRACNRVKHSAGRRNERECRSVAKRKRRPTGGSRVPEVVQTGTVKRRDQTFSGSRVVQKQHCDGLFCNACAAELSRQRRRRDHDAFGHRPFEQRARGRRHLQLLAVRESRRRRRRRCSRCSPASVSRRANQSPDPPGRSTGALAPCPASRDRCVYAGASRGRGERQASCPAPALSAQGLSRSLPKMPSRWPLRRSDGRGE
jgi:hypothetical protein